MHCRPTYLICVVALLVGTAAMARATSIGADLPYTTYEAEAMQTNAAVLGPKYDPYLVETESSGERCVKLERAEDFVEFAAVTDGDALVIRYSLPDAPRGGGVNGTLDLVVNGAEVRKLALTSRYAHLYGQYPFSNDSTQGKPRNFYDELRIPDVRVRTGDRVRLQGLVGAEYCIVDLVDVEQVAAPLAPPADALSVRDFGAKGDGQADDSDALLACVAAAKAKHRVVWVPSGEYKITRDVVVADGVRIQGAGMWHTRFVGDEALYDQANRRVRFRVTGTGAALADFAIVGRLNYRNDQEPNDGVVGQNCSNATIERVWIEHTKTGVWIYNGDHVGVIGCRFRDLLADGVNLCVGTIESVVENCSARGTGDDCFAMWPVPDDQGFVQRARPGHNVIRRCTGQLPFLANGGCIYGGADNRIEACRFVDITAGSGILISTTFPTSDPARHVDNNFSGATVVQDCELVRCGGYDHDWAWRAAYQICLDRRSISGLQVSRISIRDSISDGLSVVAPGRSKGEGTLADTRIEDLQIGRCGLARPSREFWIRNDVSGGLSLQHSDVGTILNESPTFTIDRR